MLKFFHRAAGELLPSSPIPNTEPKRILRTVSIEEECSYCRGWWVWAVTSPRQRYVPEMLRGIALEVRWHDGGESKIVFPEEVEASGRIEGLLWRPFVQGIPVGAGIRELSR